MKIRHLLALSAAALMVGSAVIAANKPKDEVLMQVNGKDIMLSEFEYLYNKNNAQQLQPQTIDEYLETFTNYRLKIADAEAAHMDTATTFVVEYNGLVDDLSKPYMTDSTVMDRLLQEAYDRYSHERDYYHIMFRPNDKALADSIHDLLVQNPSRWDELAAQYSTDRGSSTKGGRLYWRSGGQFPYKWEEAAFATPVGEISDVVNSGFGWHIILSRGERPNQGKIQIQHILRLVREGNDSIMAVQRHVIDSLYTGLQNGTISWEEASKLSDDRTSRAKFGVMEWSGYGELPVPLDSIMFAAPLNQIDTLHMPWGLHIARKVGHQPMKTLDEMRPDLLKAMQGDERADAPRQARLQQLAQRYHAQLIPDNLAAINTLTVDTVGLDSATVVALSDNALTAFTVNGQPTTLGQVIQYMDKQRIGDPRAAVRNLPRVAQEMMDKQLYEQYKADLASIYPEYRNLLGEYRDGILFFNVTNENVWERATRDHEGLEQYFQAHRNDYKWDQPRFKGIIVMTTTDSVMNLVAERLPQLPGLSADSLSHELRRAFGRNVRVEANVVAAKGDHPVVDYVAFNGPKPERVNGRWEAFVKYSGELVDQPETAADVRGLVITDYQNQLDRDYIQALRAKYPVTVNRKALKKVRRK